MYIITPFRTALPPRPRVTTPVLQADLFVQRILTSTETKIGALASQNRPPDNIFDRMFHIVAGDHLSSCLAYGIRTGSFVPIPVSQQRHVSLQTGLILYRADPLLRELLGALYRFRRSMRVRQLDWLYESAQRDPTLAQICSESMLVNAQEAALCSSMLLTPPVEDARAKDLVLLFWFALRLRDVYNAAHPIISAAEESCIVKRVIARKLKCR